MTYFKNQWMLTEEQLAAESTTFNNFLKDSKWLESRDAMWKSILWFQLRK